MHLASLRPLQGSLETHANHRFHAWDEKKKQGWADPRTGLGCLGFGRDGCFRYYMSEPIRQNDPKGNGPFILAGVEIYRLLKG